MPFTLQDLAGLSALFVVVLLIILAARFQSRLPDWLTRPLGHKPPRYQLVRFRITDEAFYGSLLELVQHLKRSIGEMRARTTSEDEYYNLDWWRSLLPREVQARFLWPTEEKIREHLALWETEVVRILPPAAYLGHHWSFDRVLYWLLESEFELLECARLRHRTAELRLEARSYPYGGLGAVIALVEGFGFEVIGAIEWNRYQKIGAS